jgi:ATP-dependent DNA helicase RecQ
MNAKQVLEKHWGYTEFRPLQEDIVNSVLDGKDTLGLMPTGGGKSITFQVPALMREGICIVVTPLIALMKDQVENLQQKEIKARKIHSGIQHNEINSILNECIHQEVKFLYIAPERIQTSFFVEKLKLMNVNLIVVDEAHCISQWGHDFRPSYLTIHLLREYCKVPILALTATATNKVITDIQVQLKLNDPVVFTKSFERKNIVYYVRTTENKLEDLINTLSTIKGSGIVYVRNRKRCVELAKILKQKDINADYYHAGLDMEIRNEKQKLWTENKIRIIVSTNAFGMGIDKPNVRVVVHYTFPESLEEYYQEAGRGGRDGKKAFAVLLADKLDASLMKKRVSDNFPPIESIKRIYQAMCNYLKIPLGSGKNSVYDFDLSDFAQTFKMNVMQVYASLKILNQSGYIEYSEDVNLPSKVVFNYSRDDLYKFQVENAGFDNFIKLLLRSYSGLFTEYTSISEKTLSKRAQTNEDTIYNYLIKLAKYKVITYIPRKNKPIVTFLSERLDEKNLRISKQFFNERKKVYTQKNEAMLNYASSSNRCRSLLLLEYFNDYSAKPCGNCDVCRSRSELQLSPQEFNQIKDSIKQLTLEESNTLKQLVDKLEYSEEKIFKVIDWLIDNEHITTKTNGEVKWNTKN